MFYPAPHYFMAIRDEYFWSYERELTAAYRHPLLFDQRALDAFFGKMKYVNKRSRYTREHEDYMKLAFDITEGYEWRYAENWEWPYHRPEGGWVAVPVSFFRAGFRLGLHRFIRTLFADHFKCGFGQFSPNSIRCIVLFVACCAEMG